MLYYRLTLLTGADFVAEQGSLDGLIFTVTQRTKHNQTSPKTHILTAHLTSLTTLQNNIGSCFHITSVRSFNSKHFHTFQMLNDGLFFLYLPFLPKMFPRTFETLLTPDLRLMGSIFSSWRLRASFKRVWKARATPVTLSAADTS